MENRIVNTAAYKFTSLVDLEALGEKMYLDLVRFAVQGTIWHPEVLI